MGLLKKIILACLISLPIVLPVRAEDVPLLKRNGVYYIPGEVNESMTLIFLVDTGAAEVTLTEDVVRALIRTGTVEKKHILPDKIYVLADGRKVRNARIMLEKIKIGKRVLRNIEAAISHEGSHLLIGQNLLEKMGPWTFDTNRQVLVFTDYPTLETEESLPKEDEQETIGHLRNRLGKANPKQVVELFFKSVADERYAISWASLSAHSKDEIVQLVAREGEIPPKFIRDLFERNDLAVNGFWTSFRTYSDIPKIAPIATYQQIENGPNQAIVQVKVGERELPFMVFRENDEWRLGLIESIKGE